MKFKYNWGWGIAIFYTVFVLFLIANVLFSSLQRTDLVEDDYYEKELKYQDKINKIKRYNELAEKIEIIQTGNSLVIKYPKTFDKNLVKGKLHFYKPSNALQDRVENIKLNDNNLQIVDVSGFPSGFWRLKIDWSVGDSSYYLEKEIRINKL